VCGDADTFCGSVTKGEGSGAGHYRAIGRSFFEDPASINVTFVENRVEWRPRDGCAAHGSGTVGRTYDWYGSSGWRLDWANWSYGATCDRVFSKSSAVFENDGFCTVPTYNSYSPNVVRGKLGGKAEHHWRTVMSGGCTYLLDFEHVLIWRDLNG
jgi:hypothetical protein